MADSADLGVDVSTYVLNDEGELDLDPFGNEIAGPVVVAESVARGWETNPGDLPWSTDDGADISRYLNADISPADTLAIAIGLEEDAKRDERVDAIDVAVAFDDASSSLDITGNGLTSAGPFTLVLSPDDLTIAAIKAGT